MAEDEDRFRGRGYDRGHEVEQKPVEIMEDKIDKVVNMAAGNSDDALICCIKNTVKDYIMDSGASFHATYCKEELERFKLRSGKVRLADDKTLDISGIGDVVLKTSFAEEAFLHNVREDKETVEFGVAERLNQTFRAESTGLRAEALKMLWADSVMKDVCEEAMKCAFTGNDSYEMRYSFQDTKSHQSQVVLVDIPKNLADNDSIVAEYRLSSEFTQSPCRSSDMIKGSKNSRSFEDSERSDEEYSKNGASSKEEGFETPQRAGYKKCSMNQCSDMAEFNKPKW
ncbi:hypothetical protein Tco_0687345 [Tanacetum coccineum]